MNKPKLLLTIVCLFVLQQLFSQDAHKISLESGFGHFEGIYLGTAYQYHKRLSATIGIGTWEVHQPDETYFTVLLKNSMGFNFKKQPDKTYYNWWISGKAVYWRFEDPYYIWQVISFIPTLERNFHMHEKVDLRVGFGPSIKLVLDFQRKTFQEVGWPYNVRPNFNVQVIYRL